MKRIAIVGAGVSGLAAATAIERARLSGADVEFALFERSERLGGVILTEQIDGCIVEAGPDSFLSEKTYAADFCRSLGLGEHIIGSNDSERITYIVVDNRLVAMPDGLMFMVPTKILPTITTRMFSWRTKIRMGMELFAKPPALTDQDESVADFVRRHYGQEVVDRLADPLLSGVYGGDAASLSVNAVLPRFASMEGQYGSLSRGMLAARRKAAEAAKENKPRPLFSSLRNGMQQLVGATIDFLPSQAIPRGTEVQSVARDGGNWTLTVNGASENYDGLIIATPAHAAGKLLRDVNESLATELNSISYTSSVTVALGYERSDLADMPPGFGFLVPRAENRRIRAVTFVHNKFPHRTPPDKGILRAFLGGLNDQSVLALTDNEILEIVRRELHEILELAAPPVFERVYRWNQAMAQYSPGHLDRVKHIRQAVEAMSGFALAGNAYQGIGVPDCIASGLLAANSVLDQLGLPKADIGIDMQPNATR